MHRGMTTADAVHVAISIAGAAIAFIIVYLIARAVLPGDTGMLIGPILGTYAGVATPYVVVRLLGTGAASKARAPSPAHG